MTQTSPNPALSDTTDAAAPIRVALIVASVRSRRLADALLPWLRAELDPLPWLDLDVIDLRDETIDDGALEPGAPGPLADRLDRADAFVVLTPEYNHSYPGPLKSLIDGHYAEWARKPVTFVSYGSASGGLRAVEHLRPVFSELRATTTRNVVSLVAPWERLDPASGRYAPTSAEVGALDATLAELRWWAVALRTARAAAPVPA